MPTEVKIVEDQFIIKELNVFGFIKMESIMECHTENQQTPMQLYTKGMIQYGFRGMEEEIVNPNDYGIDWDGPISKSNDVDVILVDEPKQIINIIFYNLW
ncbi:unnamed protein product [Rhizophagus irregularis]|nr:unnamed protein product [Rhizophagus irregularis]